MTRLAAFRQPVSPNTLGSLKQLKVKASGLERLLSRASTLQTLKIRAELRSVKHLDADHVNAALAFS